MITVQDVKKDNPHLDDEHFSEIVLDLIIGTTGRDIHFASYLDGYLNALHQVKSIYNKAPLELLEALDSEWECNDY